MGRTSRSNEGWSAARAGRPPAPPARKATAALLRRNQEIRGCVGGTTAWLNLGGRAAHSAGRRAGTLRMHKGTSILTGPFLRGNSAPCGAGFQPALQTSEKFDRGRLSPAFGRN